MNPYEELVNEIKETVEPTKQMTWYCCQECNQSYQSARPMTTCIKCQAQCYQWPGETQEKAAERALRAKGAAMAKSAAPTTKSEPAPYKAEPEPTPTPKVRVKKEKVQPKPEPKPEPAPVEQDEQAEENQVDDREAAVEAFIEEYKLNEVQPVPVGTAVVQTIGFTKWVDKKPNFVLMPPTMTGLEFQQVLDAARAEQPFTSIDCALCSHVDNAKLNACLYRGDMVASLNAGQGTTMVKPGYRVKIGALCTSKRKLRFVVMEVI